MAEWRDTDASTPVAGKYLVKTVRPHFTLKGVTVPCNVIQATVHYTTDEKGRIKQHWSCNNQIVTQWLDESEQRLKFRSWMLYQVE